MSFSGKRYKRTRHENIEELVKSSSINKELVQMLKQGGPVFCYTKIKDKEYNFVLENDNKHMSFNFTLGVEMELERRDGEKVKVTYTMPKENVLNQVVKMPEGKLLYFSREFNGKEGKMTLSLDDTDVKATVYFEQVE